MDEKGKIIVFQYYDTSIDANIVKTKLDAYGIPCFLTEENMANLYPGVGYHLTSFRVRLHLFSDDVEEANKILEEESHLELDDESVASCPRCRSKNLGFSFLIIKSTGAWTVNRNLIRPAYLKFCNS